MRKIILFFIFLSISFNSFCGIVVVSDLDDTIKIMNSGNTLSAGINALKKAKTFSGIKELFAGLKSYTNELYILSASPTILHKKIIKDLNSVEIYPKAIILKKWGKGEDKFEYKVREILNIIKNSPHDFIFLGDDVGKDPEVYAEIKKLFPEKVKGIYIHVINGRSLPFSLETYFSSFEVAVKEYQAGRMFLNDVRNVIDVESVEESTELVFPDFAVCPTDKKNWDWLKDTTFYKETLHLVDRYLNYCLTQNLFQAE